MMNLRDEEEAFSAVRAALRDALHVFTRGVPPVSAADATPLTPEQCIQLFDVYLRLILETSDDASAYILSRTYQTEFFDVITRFVFQPLLFTPSTQNGYAAQQALLDLRSAASRVLNHVLLRATSLGAEGVATGCLRAMLDSELVPQLLAAVGSPAVPEVVRCTVAEALFIVILRFGAEGQTLLVQNRGVAAVTHALILDASTAVRNYAASVLRELAESFSGDVAIPNTLSACIKSLATDSSPDVRILSAEVLALCIRNCVDARYLLLRPQELLQTADEVITADSNLLTTTHAGPPSPPRRPGTVASTDSASQAAVQEAVCRLLQTCCLTASTSAMEDFFEAVSEFRLLSRLALAASSGTTFQTNSRAHPTWLKAKAAVATTLRFFLQYTPHRFRFAEQLVQDFAAITGALKSVIDAGKTLGVASSESASSESLDTYSVEMAVSVALVAAQSPAVREWLRRELLTVPMWATTLKASLVGCLNRAALELYGTIDILDCTGVYLNALAGVEWSETNKPRRHSIEQIFALQEARVTEQQTTSATGSGRLITTAPSFPTTDQEWDRRTRLTFVLLNYAAHLALTPSPADEPQPHSGAGMSASAATPPSRSVNDSGTTAPLLSISRGGAGGSELFATPATPRGRTSVQPGRHPIFPNVSQRASTPAAATARSALTPKEREAMAVAFDKFNSSFQLTLQLAECYAKKRQEEALYLSTKDGFVVRAQKLKNPWGPVVQKASLRSWTVKDVEDGDLFYFAIPFDDLNERSVAIVTERAKRHVLHVKKTIVTIPQTAKGRRWVLYDLLNFVMPRTLRILGDLYQLCCDHGEASLRFPVFLFREKEMHLGERCLHPGNLIEVVEQVKFYFSQRPTELVGANDEAIAALKKKMASLSSRDGGNQVRWTPTASDDEDGDEEGYHGHGAISSESEGES